MRIESYGPTFPDISKQPTTNAVQTGKIKSVAEGPAALDKTTLSAGATASEGKTTTAPVAIASGDKTTLSSAPAAVQSLTQSALQTAALRAAKVEDLKQVVNSAQYKLDAAKTAEALSDGGF